LLRGSCDFAQSSLVRFLLLQIVLIVNSFASSVNPRNTVQVHQYLARRHGVQVVETNERGHATRFARDAAARGVDAVVAFGGDGTLNEVATGLAGSGTALAILPGGSTNVFACSLGEIDTLLDRARATLDPAARKADYNKAQGILACEGPIAHLAYAQLFTARRTNVQGFEIIANRSLSSLSNVAVGQ